MTNKEKTIKELKEVLDSLDITNKYRLNIIRAIEYLQEEPVSEDSKKHISIVTERMLKEGPIPTLRGKEKADFENEFNRFKQITGMTNWPSREEIYKNVILWFIAWSKEHLKIGDIVDESEMDKQPISEDSEEAADFYIKTHGEILGFGRQTFKAGAKWQEKKDQETIELAEDHAMLAGIIKGTEHTIGNVRSILNKVACKNYGLDVNGDYCEQPYVELDNEFRKLLKED